MKSRYELPFSLNWVQDWTHVEAAREVYQNAMDGETVNPQNVMSSTYDAEAGILRVCNAKSELTLDSILVGSTTKSEDSRTIGKHGEGYKAAILVLLREGKEVTIYNNRKQEIWRTSLVNSRRYNNNVIPVITVEKNTVAGLLNKGKDEEFVFEIKGLTQAEYDAIVQKNLNLRESYAHEDVFGEDGDLLCKILTSEEERGNLYVDGLFICNTKGISYGYSFPATAVTLDRDRRLVYMFSLTIYLSKVWRAAFKQNVLRKELVALISKGALDVTDLDITAHAYEGTDREISEVVADSFYTEYGAKAIPVDGQAKMNALRRRGEEGNAVIVNTAIARYVTNSSRCVESDSTVAVRLSDELAQLVERVQGRLTRTEVAEFMELVKYVGVLEDEAGR